MIYYTVRYVAEDGEQGCEVFTSIHPIQWARQSFEEDHPDLRVLSIHLGGAMTLDIIASYWNQVLEEAARIYPRTSWAHQPGTISWATKQSGYAWITETGDLQVHTAFGGSLAYDKLLSTLRHECAHLIAGTHNGHNKIFKRVADRLGIDVDSALVLKQGNELRDSISFKWTVIAHFKDGTRQNLGGVHKRTRKYTDYGKDGRFTMRVGNKVVDRFEFIEN